MSRHVTLAEGMQNAYKTLIKYPKERRPLSVHGKWYVRILIGFIWLWILSTIANLHICKRLSKYQLCSRDCHMEWVK
jgi:cytochrome bd-type quinol oxidase subunit 1